MMRLFLFLVLPVSIPSALADVLVIRDVHVTYPPTSTVDLELADGRVRLLHGGRAAPVGARDIDGGGRYALRAWADAHHHVSPAHWQAGEARSECLPYPDLLLSQGVVEVLDLNVPFELGARVATAMTKTGLRYRMSGPNIGAPGGWGVRGVRDPDEMAVAVDDAIAGGASLLKLVLDDMGWLTDTAMPRLANPTFAAGVDRGQERHLPVVVHVNSVEALGTAIDAGVDAIAHSIVDEEIDAAMLARMRDRGVVYIPTLSVYHAMDRYDEAVGAQQALLGPQARCEALPEGPGNPYEAWWDGLDRLRAQRSTIEANLLRAFEAGVTIALGTDAGTPGVFAGASVRLELDLMLAAGMPIEAALDAATPVEESLLGRAEDGRLVRDGVRGEILLFDRDPHAEGGLDSLNCVIVGNRITGRCEAGVPAPLPEGG